MIDLIILDLYGTLVGRGDNSHPRRGFADFMNRYQDKNIVLATDDSSKKDVNRHLRSLSIIDLLDGVYTGNDMTIIAGYEDKRKNLKKICRDFKVNPNHAVFISDGKRDLEDAKRDKVRFIHVPYYEVEDEIFSFAMINLSGRMRRYLDLRDVNSGMAVEQMKNHY